MYKLPASVVRVIPLALMTLTVVDVAAQQAYPRQPIRILVGVGPGGSTNNMARLIAQKFQESWGQPVIVENRSGANTSIAAEAVARAVPDGYTLLVATNTHIAVPLMMRVRYQPLKDFAPIGTLGVSRYVMSVHPSVPARTLKEFIAYAKARPNQLNYGSSGSGGGSHIDGAVFDLLTGVRTQHVPYKGGGQALVDAIAGHVQISYNTPMIVAPHAASGALRPLAVTGPKRVALLPGVPTFAEAGLPAFDEKAWWGLYAPAGTPRPIVDKLAAELKKILTTPSVQRTLESQGAEALISTPDEFAAMMRAESANLGTVIKSANIKIH
ncbi:tripartite tricarboxylate transporter substrate binding protein [Pseudoduganella umbonata]|uniref:Tripartite tricarboxylate transporter substrate binding protein n=1 Tax=Pseudoduganella umbonata TaxID=864828 RepID=A0A4P8HLU3_9BURK|nr:tripartite tricarboxylate transporter substrate binding protein [Pseudoduganella umbonata]MBB3221610.1 tripartite-type tricarboxylate transporter receptor subunit TctC [Pseudoduganella umbonata]QCP09155.1 tripartite tricarboxylate transporter substrate binding protein [Pseudoduganella umbonata]